MSLKEIAKIIEGVLFVSGDGVDIEEFKSRFEMNDREFNKCLDILKEKGKTKYWLYIQLGLSYQNFNKLVNNQTNGIKFENLKALCDILECTPNDLFYEYHTPKKD